MKKILILVSFCVLGTKVNSQIKVIKNNALVEVGKAQTVGLYKKNNTYTITYQDINNANLNNYRSFSFNNIDGDFETLYQLILNSLIEMPQADVILELPNDVLYLHFDRNYGQNTVQFIQHINKNKKYVGKSHFLTRAEVDKLFGKTKLNEQQRFKPKQNSQNL